MKVAYVMDPPAALNPATDTTIAMMQCHIEAGERCWVVMRGGVRLWNSGLKITAREINFTENKKEWFTLEPERQFEPADFDLIALRLEPPVDAGFRLVCQMLEVAQRAGTPVVNKPDALICHEEKLYAQLFDGLGPVSLISSDGDALLSFAAGLEGGCVVKVMDTMGGKGVYVFDQGDSNLDVVVRRELGLGNTLQIQERLAEIAEGDRRVLVINGAVFPTMLNRLPAKGSHLANMAAGGDPTIMPIGDVEQRIASEIAPKLAEQGIILAGLDVIGGKLTEINITCPTGLKTISEQGGGDPCEELRNAFAAIATAGVA